MEDTICVRKQHIVDNRRKNNVGKGFRRYV
nr:MAG TPA: hypothetical protein [Caudoviricetes sp.]